MVKNDFAVASQHRLRFLCFTTKFFFFLSIAAVLLLADVVFPFLAASIHPEIKD
jgi:hypothetical protein